MRRLLAVILFSFSVPVIGASVVVGEPAPDVEAKLLDGATQFRLSANRGKVTLINFWATWCGPCKKELPDLISLSKELAPKGVKFIGVSVDRAPNVVDLVRTFCTEQGITYQILLSNDDMEAAFGNPRAIPTTVLVDADGNIAQTIVGLRTKEFYAQAITALIK